MIKRGKKIMAAIMTAIMITTTSYTVFAAENDGWTEAKYTEEAQGGKWETWCETWETIKNDWTQLSITPGKDATELNFAWYSNVDQANPKVKISNNIGMIDAIEFIGAQSNAVPGYKSNKVDVTGLVENSTYYYSYGTEGNWSTPVEIKTQDTSRFGFFLVGDPQIGSSLKNESADKTGVLGQDKSVRNDTFNWNNTINKALSIMPNASFMISAGDQISIRNKKATTEEALAYTENEIEYAGYLNPEALKSLPVATTLGNHDAVSGNYSYHFNNPNASKLGSTVGGGNYYYTYGNTLFIMLNTNNSNIAEHKQFIEEAVNNSPDATWKVVTLHQDIYGSGEHSNEPEIAELRYSLVPIFEENNIDVVLTGHDHTYARSKILKGGVKDESTFLDEDEYEEFFEQEFEADYAEDSLVTDEKYLNYLKSIEDENAVVTDLDIQGSKVVNPDGILYITANSASGSKYYNNVPRQQAYIANRWQDDVPTFSTINVDEVSLSISTYRTDTMELIDDTYTIVKELDKTNLEELVTVAEGKVESQYTTSTWNTFVGALANVRAIIAQGDATSDIITQAYTDLNTAMNALTLKGDVTALNTAIEEATKVVEAAVVGSEKGNYSQESKDALQKAIDEAKAVATSNDVNQVVVDEATTALKTAVTTFKGKVIGETTTGGNTNTSTNTTTNNKPGKGDGTNVNTGDVSNGFVYGVLGLAVVGLAAVNFRRKRESAK